MGGTGKTPILMRLADDLLERGLRPAILTRGYQGVGAPGSAPAVLRGRATSDHSDEARLMVHRLPKVPIIVGAQRAAAAQSFLADEKPDLFLLDDGFQHWPIDRAIDLVCLDALDPWAGGHLFPWGKLREPVQSLARATFVALTRRELIGDAAFADIMARVRSVNSTAPVIEIAFQASLETLDGKPAPFSLIERKAVIAVSAIGHPDSFEESLRRRSIDVTPLRYRDHHAYTAADADLMIARAESKNAAIVTTEKDAVKLRSFSTLFLNQPCYVVRIEPAFSIDAQAAWNLLLERCVSLCR